MPSNHRFRVDSGPEASDRLDVPTPEPSSTHKSSRAPTCTVPISPESLVYHKKRGKINSYDSHLLCNGLANCLSVGNSLDMRRCR